MDVTDQPPEATTGILVPILGRGTATERRRRALSRAIDWIEVARQADDDRAVRHDALQRAVLAILAAR